MNKPDIELLSPPDNGLVKKAKSGDFRAFEELVSRNEGRIYSIAYRMLGNKDDAKDILQETFMKAFKKLPDFKEESSFSTWITRIALNEVFMKLRKEKGNRITSLDELIELDEEPLKKEIVDWSKNPSRLQEIKESREILESSIKSLPEIYRVVFLLRDIEGLPTEEVAKILKLSIPAVKSRLLRARLSLRGKLNEFFKS